jgi:hypothetical protein
VTNDLATEGRDAPRKHSLGVEPDPECWARGDSVRRSGSVHRGDSRDAAGVADRGAILEAAGRWAPSWPIMQSLPAGISPNTR